MFRNYPKRNLVISIGIWSILVLIWQLLAMQGRLNQAFIASPVQIGLALSRAEFWMVFGLDGLATLSLLLLGLGLGYLCSYLVVLVGLFWKPGMNWLQQVNRIIKYIPAPVAIPLAILSFGVTEASKIAVIAFSSFILCFNYILGILDKEEQSYAVLQDSWRISAWSRFRHFVWPISNYLSYRLIPNLIVWSLGVGIFTEIILGGEYGLGVRLVQLQQLYQTGALYSYIGLILIIAFGLEKIAVTLFARYRWDSWKITAGLLILTGLLGGFGFQTRRLWQPASSSTVRRKIATYRAGVNVPLLVYAEKYNNLNLELEFVGSGIQAIDALQAGKVVASGYSDMPNVISGNQKNKDLQVISAVVETPTRPTLFLISTKPVQTGDYSALNNTKIGYYPNNPIVQKGLDFVLLLNRVQTSSVQYNTGNDPGVLSQSLVAGQSEALLTIEPYVTQAEQQLNIRRLNPRESAIKGIAFQALPLAGLTVDTGQLTQAEINQFQIGISQAKKFIDDHTDADNKPVGELRQILTKYNINPDMNLSEFQTGPAMQRDQLDLLLKLMKQLGIEFDQEVRAEQVYWSEAS